MKLKTQQKGNLMKYEENRENGTVVMAIRLGNRDFNLERKQVAVAELKLDPHNPRLTYALRGLGGAATDADLHKLLWKQDSVKDLSESIYNNGGLIEDPIIRRDGIVVEGNCRTVALRELRKKHPEDNRFSKIFVQLLPVDVSEVELMTLLGELHVAGKIGWGAFEEAEYVWKMQNVFNKTYDYLAAHLRWSRGKLAQKIGAYEHTKRYIEETGDKNGVNRFSHFEEFMKKKELRERAEKDSSFMKEFQKWVLDGKLKDSKDVRHLPEILENDIAFAKFKKGDLIGAKQALYAANPSMNSSLYSILDQAVQELQTIPLMEIEDLRNGAQAKIEKLKSLSAALQTVAKHAEIKL
jgi:hypothetical protein